MKVFSSLQSLQSHASYMIGLTVGTSMAYEVDQDYNQYLCLTNVPIKTRAYCHHFFFQSQSKNEKTQLTLSSLFV